MISVSDSPCSPTVYWIDNLKLFPFNQQRLLEGEQLNASILMAVTTIYRTQFPELPPIQDPAYVLNLKKLCPARDDSMYFHNHDGHWTLSQLTDGQVNHYDSLQTKFISSTLGEQPAALNGHVTVGGEFTVYQQQVQVQSGSIDCGLFTIACNIYPAWRRTCNSAVQPEGGEGASGILPGEWTYDSFSSSC